MLKQAIRAGARKFGVGFVNTDRFGVDPDHDLHRFAASRPIKAIFDVGGNFGQTALRYLAAFPTATVYTFEPVPDSFQRMQRAVSGKDAIRAFNLALGAEPGKADIRLAADS